SWEAICYVVALSIYQVIRHYFLAKHGYFALCGIDLLYSVMLISPILFVSYGTYMTWVSMGSLALGLTLVSCLTRCFPSSVALSTDRELIQFSINNLVGSGVVVLLPKVIAVRWSAEEVATVALYISVLSMLAIFSRAYVNYQIPLMSRELSVDFQGFSRSLARRRRNNLNIVG